MRNVRDCFVIMPFSGTSTCTESQWTEIYENVFKPAIEECGHSCDRALSSTGSLIRSIIERLRYSRIVLADITDRNSNVFYELGVRHSLSKRTIIVAQGDTHVPSDLKGYWYTCYGTTPGQVAQFKKDIKRLIAQIENEPDRSDSPVSDYLERENLSVSAYAQKENIKKLGALYTECSGNLLQLSALLSDSSSSVYVTYDCLGLLLQSLYIDVGPQLLKTAYELIYMLRSIESGKREEEIINLALEALTSLSIEIFTLRTNLISGQYEEPTTISTMVWRPAHQSHGLIMMDDKCTSLDISKSLLKSLARRKIKPQMLCGVALRSDPADFLKPYEWDEDINLLDLTEGLHLIPRTPKYVSGALKTSSKPLVEGLAKRTSKSPVAKKKKLRVPKNKGG